MEEPLETAELLAFARTVEARSLSRAAAELGVPRATISRRLGRLEERLGVRLLRRTTRSLALTDAGELLYRQARVVIAAVEEAEASVRRGSDEICGDLRVSVPPVVDDVFPLYLQVYNRSKYHFEKLSKAYLCRLGPLMPDKVRFFIWRRQGRIVAFTVCMLQGDEFYAEYIGLDYAVALDLHLYHYAVRGMIEWAIANGYKWFCSSGLNYDPKFHLRCVLDPIDLYVRHTSPIVNAPLRLMLPWLNPVFRDESLKRFPNYDELWATRQVPSGDARPHAATDQAPSLSSG